MTKTESAILAIAGMKNIMGISEIHIDEEYSQECCTISSSSAEKEVLLQRVCNIYNIQCLISTTQNPSSYLHPLDE